MRILFNIYFIGVGGAERVTSILVNELAKRGHDIHLVVHSKIEPEYPINDDIHFYRLGEHKYDQLKEIIVDVQPDIIVAVTNFDMIHYILMDLSSDIPTIASDHTNFQKETSSFTHHIRFYYYTFADVVTVLTENDKEFMKDTLHNMKVMYNPLTFPRLDHKVERRKSILCVGRISAWDVKGFDNMIRMWGKIAHKHPDWCLEIVGDSAEEKDYLTLLNIVQEENVSDSVYFLGWCDDVDMIMQKCSIFALSSREEGFPCVLLEAMSQGCTPVAFAIRGNINEIITDGEDGFVVPDGDFDTFIKKLEELMDNEDLREQMGEKAIASMERFEMNKIVDKWEELLIDTVNKKKQS